MTAAARSVVFIVPGDLETLTGGYGYDRRIIAGLRHLGWQVRVESLGASFPHPTPEARQQAAARFAAVQDGTVVLVDGLAFGALPVEAEYEHQRLCLVALVHHPLAEETGIDSGTAAALEASERRALGAARLVVVTSRSTAAALPRYNVNADRIVVVEPGTDPAPLAHGSDDGLVHLLCVASLIPRKGHETLVNALASLKERPWHLTCVGGDRDRKTASRIRLLIQQLGLVDRVRFTGDLHHPKLDDEYDRADLFVLPTFHEGYGMVVGEALARGLPVISTPTGGIAELVRSDAGILVTPGNVAELARAIGRLVDDQAERARLAEGARRVRAHLPTWEAAAQKMAAALERASRP